MGTFSQLIAKHYVKVHNGIVNTYEDQDIVERLNQTLAQTIFAH